MEVRAKEPVTVSGWYERTDGTVAWYGWFKGVVCMGGIVPSWAYVPDKYSPVPDEE